LFRLLLKSNFLVLLTVVTPSITKESEYQCLLCLTSILLFLIILDSSSLNDK